MKKIKNHMVYACFAGAVLLAAALFSGCDHASGGKINQPQAQAYQVYDEKTLLAALTSSTVSEIAITKSFNTDIDVEVKRDKAVTIPAGKIVTVKALKISANVTLQGPAAVKNALSVKTLLNAVSQVNYDTVDTSVVGIIKVKTRFTVNKSAAFQLKGQANLAFAPAVTKENAVVDGTLSAEVAGSIYRESSSSALEFSGSGVVRESSGSEPVEAAKASAPPRVVETAATGGTTTGGATGGGGTGGGGVAAPPVPAYTISGNLSAVSETIGGRYFSFTDLGDTVISLQELVPVEDASVEGGIRYTTPGDNVGTAAANGSAYTISGVQAGTYRLTAEDPTGLYDFIAPKIVVAGDVSQNINLTVFQGLKLTVRIPREYNDPIDYQSGQAQYNGSFILPVRPNSGFRGEEIVTVNLDVDWGDGAASQFDTTSNGVKDTAYTHYYTESLGSKSAKDFVIRISGTCISNGTHSEMPGKFGMGYNASITGIPVSGGGQWASTDGYFRHGYKSKIVRAAGNITALTTGATATNNAYAGAFWECKNLEDISGLTFTDTGAVGSAFLVNTFAKCTSLKTIPATLLPLEITVGNNFLQKTFQGSGVETIPAGFLPSYTSVGSSFLNQTFGGIANAAADGSSVKEIPAGFIPTSITEASGSFLSATFANCKELETIPANFVSHITGVIGNDFLQETFKGCTSLTNIPANFVPQNPTSISKSFLNSTFAGSGLTSIPVDFIPSAYENISIETALSGTFADIKTLTTANLDFLKNIKAGDYNAFASLFYKCANLTEAWIPYFYIDPSYEGLFESAFQDTGNNFKLHITGGDYGNPVSVLEVYSSAGLADTKVSAIYLDSADLVTAYQNSTLWNAISDSKFQVKQD